MKWFVAFVVASVMCKVTMKRIGLSLDRGKIGTTSMFFVGGQCSNNVHIIIFVIIIIIVLNCIMM